MQGRPCKPLYKAGLQRPGPFVFSSNSHTELSFSFIFHFMKLPGQNKPLSGQEKLNIALGLKKATELTKGQGQFWDESLIMHSYFMGQVKVFIIGFHMTFFPLAIRNFHF